MVYGVFKAITLSISVLTVLSISVIPEGMAHEDFEGHRTTIQGTEVTWEFYDSKGNYYNWNMPISTYEYWVDVSKDLERKTIDLRTDNGVIETISLDGFATIAFTNVIDGIYDNAISDADFVWEVWYVVSQLTVYDEDLDDYSEGRFSLETFTRTGGDCEDLAILIADMLMSSEHTTDWTFQYVYMDGDNPTDPQDMNHVMLVVNDGTYDYFIEATASPDWDHYPEGVTGWFFDVVTYDEEYSSNNGSYETGDTYGELSGMVTTERYEYYPGELVEIYGFIDDYGGSATIYVTDPYYNEQELFVFTDEDGFFLVYTYDTYTTGLYTAELYDDLGLVDYTEFEIIPFP